MNTLRAINAKVVPRDVVTGAVTRTNAGVTRVLGPARKAQAELWLADKYANQPLVFGLVVTEFAFAAIPLLAFAAFVAGWAIFAAGVFAGIVLFWTGIALLFLVPSLFVATGLALTAFVWIVAAIFIGKKLLGLAGYPVPSVRAKASSLASKVAASSSSSAEPTTASTPATTTTTTSTPVSPVPVKTEYKKSSIPGAYTTNGSINRVPVASQTYQTYQQ